MNLERVEYKISKSVWNSVWNSVANSVTNSVGDSVWNYVCVGLQDHIREERAGNA